MLLPIYVLKKFRCGNLLSKDMCMKLNLLKFNDEFTNFVSSPTGSDVRLGWQTSDKEDYCGSLMYNKSYAESYHKLYMIQE